jgi:hypothetical protein
MLTVPQVSLRANDAAAQLLDDPANPVLANGGEFKLRIARAIAGAVWWHAEDGGRRATERADGLDAWAWRHCSALNRRVCAADLYPARRYCCLHR